MNILLVLFLVSLVASVAVTTIMMLDDAGGWGWFLATCMGAVIATVLIQVGTAYETNSKYAAAQKQYVVIVVSLWRQTTFAIEPYKVRLDYNGKDDALLVAGSDKLATPEVLAAICD